MSVTVVTSRLFAEHRTPRGHPEQVARAETMCEVAARWRERGGAVVEPRAATRDELIRVHAPEYVDGVLATRGRAVVLDPDTYTSVELVRAAQGRYWPTL